MRKSLILITLSAILITACGRAASNSAQSTSGSDKIDIAEVVFTKNLDKKLEPVDATTEFTPTEPIRVSIRINGHPNKGILGGKFFFKDKLIADISIDLSKGNSGQFFYVGDNTYTGFYFPHTDPLYISPNYHLDLIINGTAAGNYPYSIIPPADSIKTMIKRTEFAKGLTALMDPIEQTTIFAPSDNVFFIGNGDFGKYSWLQADWIIGENQLVPGCSKVFILEKDLIQDRFYFSCSIKDGWPVGTHMVRLTVDDVIVTDATFTIQSSN
jgi:hypothetical protein